MRTKTLAYLDARDISDALFECLEEMSNMKSDDIGFSFVTRRDWLEGWLKDCGTDESRGQQPEPAKKEVETLVAEMLAANLDCVFICKDWELRLE